MSVVPHLPKNTVGQTLTCRKTGSTPDTLQASTMATRAAGRSGRRYPQQRRNTADLVEFLYL